jgi:hypothetical protein
MASKSNPSGNAWQSYGTWQQNCLTKGQPQEVHGSGRICHTWSLMHHTSKSFMWTFAQFQEFSADFLLEKAMLSRCFSSLDSSSSCPQGPGNLYEGRSSRHQGLLLFTHGSMGASGSPHKYYLVHSRVRCGNLRTQLWLKHKPRCEAKTIRGSIRTMNSNHTTKK